MARKILGINHYLRLGLIDPRIKTFKIQGNSIVTDGYRNGFRDRIDSLEGIEKLVDISELILSNVDRIGRLDLLSSDNLKRSVKSIVLDSPSFKDLSLFRDYRTVEKVTIHTNSVSDFSAFRYSLGKKLNFLAFTKLSRSADLSDLVFLKALETVHLHSADINECDFYRENCNLPGILEFIHPENVKTVVTSIPSDALRNFRSIKHLRVTIWNRFDEFFNYSGLARSVKYFTFSTGKYDDLDLDLPGYMSHTVGGDKRREINANRPRVNLIRRIKQWMAVKELDFDVSNEADISDILDCEFVKNGTLKKIVLPDSINWGNIKNGNAAYELRKRKIEVVSDQKDFKYVPEDVKTKEPAVVYFLCGPSGAGKSTLARYLRDELKLIEVPSFTTRPYRNAQEKKKGTLIQVTEQEFEVLRKEGHLAMVRSRGDIRYAMDYNFYREAVKKGGKYIYDAGHIDPSLQFRSSHPNVEVILRVPPVERVVGGLITRTAGLSKEYRQLVSMGEDASHIEKNILDAQARIAVSSDEAKLYASYSMVVGVHVVADSDYDAAMQRVKQIVCGEK